MYLCIMYVIMCNYIQCLPPDRYDSYCQKTVTIWRMKISQKIAKRNDLVVGTVVWYFTIFEYTGGALTRTGQKYEWPVQFCRFCLRFVWLDQSAPSKISWPVYFCKKIISGLSSGKFGEKKQFVLNTAPRG